MSYVRTAARGVRGYEDSGNWMWRDYPPPFDIEAPCGSVAQPAPMLSPKGMGCGGDCHCGGACGGHPHGMGYFASFDPSTWGVAEWGTVAGALFVGSKVLGSHPAVRKGRKRVSKAASQGASSLGNIALIGAAAYAAWWAYSQYQAGTLQLPAGL